MRTALRGSVSRHRLLSTDIIGRNRTRLQRGHHRMSKAHDSKVNSGANESKSEEGPSNGKTTKTDSSSSRETSFLDGPAVGVDNSFNWTHELTDEDDSQGSNDDFESDEESSAAPGSSVVFPDPDIFNAYPIEVQRKIMEWTDRDIKARRDDESRRKDELMRAKIARERMRQIVPAVVIILAIACAAVTGVITRNPLFSAAFLIIPLVIIIGEIIFGKKSNKRKASMRNNHRI